MSMLEDLFGSGSESGNDSGGEERKMSVGSGGGGGSVGDEDLPSTQAHMDELFGGSDDGNSKNASGGESSSNNSSPSRNSESGQEDGGENKLSKDDEEDGEKDIQQQDAEVMDEESNENRVIPNLSSSDDDDDDEIMKRVNKSDDEGEQEHDSGEKRDIQNESMPTTQDLFGEELDVSSDEGDGDSDKKVKEDMKDDDDDDDEYERKSSDERPPSPAKEEEEDEGLSISIELPRCNIALGKELYFIKLPNFLSVDTKPFDANLYEDEIEEDEILDEEGRARLKLKVENTIRWRYSKDKDGNEIKESNCRFVRWSDGSLSMHLGNEVFDVFKMPVQGEQNHLFVQQGTGLQAQAVFKNKLTFRPHSTASQTHRKMTMSIADRMAKAQKIKMMPATERDPETSRVSSIKKEDERLRAASRRETQQRRIRDRNHLKGLSSSYLDQDMDDDEDLEGSLSAITNRYKQSIKDARNKPFIYDEDEDEGEDSEKEEKLRSAKLDIESDDEELDEELRQKREELARKKKSSRKVIEESDEELSD